MTDKTAASRTPGPWKLDADPLGIAADGALIASADTETDAAFIIRACNSYDDLVAALSECVRVLSHIADGPIADPLKYVPVSAYKETYQKARAALKRATDNGA